MLLRIEFTASDSLQPMGELLPRLSTLTLVDTNSTSFTLPLCGRSHSLRCVSSSCQNRCAGFLQDKRNVKKRSCNAENMKFVPTKAVYLCCTFPEVAFGGRYPLSLPCGARTFLMNRLSPCSRDCLAYSHGILYRKGGGLSTLLARENRCISDGSAV